MKPAACLALPLMVAAVSTSRGQVHSLGVMGDSLSDEYAEETYGYAMGWVEQLAQYRDFDVGRTASEAGQAGGTWGEPRRTGHAFNWARSGATTSSLLSQGQHTGLAAQMASREPRHAVLAIGQNDFIPYPFPGYAYFEIYNNNWTVSQIDQYVVGVVANIKEAMNAVQASSGELIFANVIDYSVAPTVWRSFFFPDPNKRDRVTAVIAQLNEDLAQLAQMQGLVVVDLFSFSKSIFGSNHNPREFLYIGNEPIALWESDTASNTNPDAGFVDDGVHPATHLQGMMGNLFLTALNIRYDAQLEPFSESEILSQAGLTYGGMDTLVEQIGYASDYVLDFSLADPFHDLDRDNDVDIRDLARFQRCFSLTGDPVPQGCHIADFDGDHEVGLTDFTGFCEALTGP